MKYEPMCVVVFSDKGELAMQVARVTINTETKDLGDFDLKYTSLDALVQLIDDNQADWTSLVIVITNPKKFNGAD